MSEQPLTHLNSSGQAHMVDVADKAVTSRIGVAEGVITMRPETLALVTTGQAAKGDVISTARIAGIMAAKKTSDLIPLCHPLMVSKVTVEITPDETLPGLHVVATVRVSGQTGVEMEALTAVSVACLTLYDMLKAVDRGMEIGPIRLLEKDGGKSGRWVRGEG